jgi:membrane-bound metal-dependent hydrolase YbcI (DUF457 family)
LANRGTHIPVGIASPWIVIFAYAYLKRMFPSTFYVYNWLLVSIAICLFAFFGERISDTVEPPDNPRHRGIFHWVGLGAVLYIMFVFFGSYELPWLSISYDSLLGLLIVSFLSGYASHFILDYMIPIG